MDGAGARGYGGAEYVKSNERSRLLAGMVWHRVRNERILKLIKKNTTKEQIKNAVNWTKQAGMGVGGVFYNGSSVETKETLEETINFALSLKIDEFHCTLMTLMPGGNLQELAKYGTFDNDWKKLSNWNRFLFRLVLQKKSWKNTIKCFRKFYFRPRIIWGYIKRIKSPSILLFTFLASWRFLNGFIKSEKHDFF